MAFIETGTDPLKAPSALSAVIAAAEAEEAGKPVKVKVIAGRRVVHEGKPFVGGDRLAVPADTAQTWIKSKWVERVPVSQKGEE